MTKAREGDQSQMRPLSRRELIHRAVGIGLGASLAPVLAACESSSTPSTSASTGTGTGRGETLNILTWQGYHDPKWIAEFTAKTGIGVTQASVGAPAEMFAKVKANPGQYDVIYCTAGWFTH